MNLILTLREFTYIRTQCNVKKRFSVQDIMFVRYRNRLHPGIITISSIGI